MNTTLWKQVQSALITLGYDLGTAGADGIPGRVTIAAVTRFQKERNLPIQYPGTVGPTTLKALGINGVTADEIVPPWVVEARRYLGLDETKDAKVLDKALRLDASEIAWCGAFNALIISSTLPKEPLPANPLGSRNWLNFGKAIDGPQIGAIASFWRGSKAGWQGHTGTVVGHDKTHLHILGGNQSNKVSVSRVAKDRLLGYRWPVTYSAPPAEPLPMTTISASVTTNEA